MTKVVRGAARSSSPEGRALARARNQKKRDWLNEQKSGPCAMCGKSYAPYQMDFHHRDPSTKSFGIGTMYSHGRKRLLEEIAKCDLLCVLCHREVEFGGTNDLQ